MTKLRSVHNPIPAWSLKRPVTVFMTFTSFIIIGFFALFQLPMEFAPDFSNRHMWCVIVYPNSTPSETDNQIGEIWEEQLRRLRSLKRLEINSNSQSCSASLEFQPDADMDLAYMEVQDSYDRIKDQLPASAREMKIYRHSMSDIPIIWMGLSSQRSYDTLFTALEHRIKPALQRIDGVAQIEYHGMDPDNIYIFLDQSRIRAHAVDIGELYSELSSTNDNPSVGSIYESNRKFLLRSIFQLETLDDYRNLPIKNGLYRLDDVAEVTKKLPKKTQIHHINGREGTTISINKESAANTVAVTREVEQAIEELKKDQELRGIEFTDFFNQADWITYSLSNLRNAGLWGGLFASIIMYLFLRRLGVTLIVLSAVPISLLASIVGLYFLDFTLNIGTLMGLMLAIGMLVDNSVVVTENIVRIRNQGESIEKACVSGTEKVGTAIVASTLTTIIVFLPLVFAKGEVGVWMRQIGTPITLSLLASLLVALSMIPVAISRFQSGFSSGEYKIIPAFRRRYLLLLKWILSNKAFAFLLVILFGFSAVIPFSKIDKNLHSGGGERQLFMRLKLPANYSLQENVTVLSRFEEIILNNSDKLNLNNMYSNVENGGGMIRLFLRSSGDDLITDSEVKNRIKALLPEVPGVSWWFGWRQGESGSSQVEITLQGNSNKRLIELADELKPKLLAIENIVDVQPMDTEPMDEVALTINREVARQNGLEPIQIAQTISTAIQGVSLPRFKMNQQEYEVWMQLENEDRETVTQLRNLLFYNEKGKGIPLNALADVSYRKGKGNITRIDGKIHHVIRMEASTSDIRTLSGKISAFMNGITLPSGYSWSLGRSFRDFDMGMQEFNQTFLLAIVLVILLLGALFESLIHPFTIIMSLPFAMVGVYWTLFFTSTELNMMSNIGLIILIGIVVNNAIVLVDHINQIKASGASLTDSILNGCADRFRPIIMTAATTLLGLAPMAVAQGGAAGQSYAPLAITVMGGLTVSTILTLIILPLFYALMDRMQFIIVSLFHQIFIRSSHLPDKKEVS